jgi:hypothetical protein
MEQIVTCRTMAGHDMPADDTALLDLLLERANTFWSFWSGDHEFLLAVLHRKKEGLLIWGDQSTQD